MSITSGDVSLNSVDIVIFNMNGDVIQTIENDGIYLKLNENNNGFAVTNIKVCLSDVVSKDGNSEETTQQTLIPCGFNTKAYYLNLNIDTKVTGKGSIKVMGGSRKGESVTFEIEPEEGYVLDFVKVIDAKGNVLTFKDYSFTMPSADVTIEANFLPENPSTFDGIFGSIVIAIVSMSCALGFTVLLNNVRKEEII